MNPIIYRGKTDPGKELIFVIGCTYKTFATIAREAFERGMYQKYQLKFVDTQDQFCLEDLRGRSGGFWEDIYDGSRWEHIAIDEFIHHARLRDFKEINIIKETCTTLL